MSDDSSTGTASDGGALGSEPVEVGGRPGPDLSGAFGRPATASLRGLLPPRPGGPGQPAPVVETDTVPEPAPDPRPDDLPAGRAAPVRALRDRAEPGTNQRWGLPRMTSREHVELLVLLALRRGPAAGREVVERLRDDSGGRLRAPANTVHRTLHRLARARLVEREASGRRPRYLLTDGGASAARSREREWLTLSRVVDSVVRSNPAPDHADRQR